MHVEELGEEEAAEGSRREADEPTLAVDGRTIRLLVDTKRAVVGAGARILFYPTLLYNVVRNKIETGFHWWDEVDEFLLLGAVPFPSDVPCLKQHGVRGVITLNEPYETLVPSSLYLDYGIEHLVIPTRDYLFAPSFGHICQAVDFIHKNVSSGRTTYVHCKAGRGRSTTIVLCYLVQYKGMTPPAAYEYVRLRRPRVLLAASQWAAIQDYYCVRVKKTRSSLCLESPIKKSPALVTTKNLVSFDESSFVVVSKSDIDGYDGDTGLLNIGNNVWAEVSLIYRVQFAGQAAVARLSCFWLRCHARQGSVLPDKLGTESCSLVPDQMVGGPPPLPKGVVVKL